MLWRSLESSKHTAVPQRIIFSYMVYFPTPNPHSTFFLFFFCCCGFGDRSGPISFEVGHRHIFGTWVAWARSRESWMHVKIASCICVKEKNVRCRRDKYCFQCMVKLKCSCRAALYTVVLSFVVSNLVLRACCTEVCVCVRVCVRACACAVSYTHLTLPTSDLV